MPVSVARSPARMSSLARFALGRRILHRAGVRTIPAGMSALWEEPSTGLGVQVNCPTGTTDVSLWTYLNEDKATTCGTFAAQQAGQGQSQTAIIKALVAAGADPNQVAAALAPPPSPVSQSSFSLASLFGGGSGDQGTGIGSWVWVAGLGVLLFLVATEPR